MDCYIAYDDYMREEVAQFSNLSYIRYNIDTNDQFYKGEMDFWDETWPVLQEDIKAFTAALLASPFRKDLEAEWGSVMFLNEEISLKTFSPEVVEDLQAENALCTEHDDLKSSAQILFEGEMKTLAQMEAYHENPDPNVRRLARDAVAGWYQENGDKLDEIFDKMVKVRTKIAQTLGYENFVELGYHRMKRKCYGAEDVAKLRQGLAEHIVPLVSRFKMEQAKRIGVDKITLYDDYFNYPDGNPQPKGTPDDIMAHGRKMYKEMSPDTAELIDVLMDNELFDVLARTGKRDGGYCTSLPAYGLPFIFANFDGTAWDVDVLTHEVGHALAVYEARNTKPSNLSDHPQDISEIHSMAMEFFAWPWMEGFFGDQTKKYYDSHLSGAVTLFPVGAMVDEFQHWIYENHTASPADRHAQWAELERKYRPYLDQSEVPFYQDGRWWQSRLHIYVFPFYYIDYVLAGVVALNFWAENQRDSKVAWDKYMKLLRTAGTKTFLDLIKEAGIPTPFEPANIKSVADAVTTWLDNRK